MTKKSPTTPPTPPEPPAAAQLPTPLTPAQVRAEATMLAGAQSLVARAALEDDDTGTETETGAVGELWLYGVVGGWWRGFDAESVSGALRKLGDVDTLVVRIHSPGGLAGDGVAIGNLLRNFDATVVVVVDGLAASAASVIAIAGDVVVMCPGSQMMLHDASTGCWGNAGELRQAADWIDSQSENYAGVYAFKAGGTSATWREVMLANNGTGTWYTADGAVAAGLADEVGTRTARSSPPTAPDDDFEDDDDMWAKVLHDVELLERHVPAAARLAWRAGASAATGAPKPPTASAGGSIPTTHERSQPVAFSDEQVTQMRQHLGLSEDADEAAILAALTTAANARTVPEGFVTVPKEDWEETRAAASRGSAAAEQLRLSERKAFLDANRTKFAAGSRAAWEKQYDVDPEGTKAHFASITEDLVPVTELGHGDDAAAEASAAEAEVDKNWRF
ncbi:head maturation protease, ClpP-related [Nocardioides sp. CPCC 205120]|uniref:head maturation protease, ClpP-related n=1 Tax=Nocardioides sp. CPCC 205120 TaxID=3406462 RepID=UPI003B508C2C